MEDMKKAIYGKRPSDVAKWAEQEFGVAPTAATELEELGEAAESIVIVFGEGAKDEK